MESEQVIILIAACPQFFSPLCLCETGGPLGEFPKAFEAGRVSFPLPHMLPNWPLKGELISLRKKEGLSLRTETLG